MKKGTEYEIFVKQVYDRLSKEKGDNVLIELHKIIKGRSGVNHEIDLYWEFEKNGIVYKTAVECKDHKNHKVTKGEIQEFQSKLNDLPSGIIGIVATNHGYQSGAVVFADSYGIIPLIIKKPEIDDFGKDALLKMEIHFEILHRTFSNMRFDFDVEWFKQHYETNRYEIKGNGKTLIINDSVEKRVETYDEFANRLANLAIENGQLIDKTSVTLHETFECCFLIDTVTQNEYKIRVAWFDVFLEIEHIVNIIDLLSIVDAIILKSDKTIIDKVFSKNIISN